MKLDRVMVHAALCSAVACRIVFLAGCTIDGSEHEDPGSVPATIGAAARGAAGEGVREDEGNSETGNVGDGGSEADMGGGDTTAEPSFADVYDILAASCGGGNNGCHITGMAADLVMPDPAAAHAALVGVASRRCEGELIVAPGDADQSVLVTVLEGGAECVKAMPLGREPLGEEAIATIRAWIDAGAKSD